MSPPCPSHEMPENLFDSVMNLNFKGPFRLASQVAHRMSQGDGGCIINISSTGALMALPMEIGKHTSELQSLMRISYAVFCLKKKKTKKNHRPETSNDIQLRTTSIHTTKRTLTTREFRT